MQTVQQPDETVVDVASGTSSDARGSTSAAPGRTELSLEQLATTLGEHASVRTIFGEPVRGDGVTVIPAARAIFGFGGGSGEGMPTEGAAAEPSPRRRASPARGSGGGGGVVVTPVGYIVLRGGDAEFRRVPTFGRLFAAAAAGALLGACMARRSARH